MAEEKPLVLQESQDQPFTIGLTEPDLINAKAAQDKFVPSRSYVDMTKDSFELANDSTAVQSLAKYVAKNELEERGGQQIDPITLNQMYPNMEVPFGKPTSLLVAQHLSDRNYERQILQARVAAGPSGYLGMATSFISGMGAHATDPIEFALGFGVGQGVNMLAKSFKATAPLAAMETGTFGRFAVSSVENAVGEAAIEPFIAFASKDNQESYTAMDAAQSVIGGAIGGSLVEMGLGRMGRFYRNYKQKGVNVAMSKTMDDVSMGNRPDVESLDIIANQKKELELREGVLQSEVSRNDNLIAQRESKYIPEGDYVYRPMAEGTNRQYYSSKPTKLQGAATHTTPHKDVYMGEGMYLSDSPRWGEEFSYKNSGFSNKSETVTYVPKDDLRLMNLDDSIDANFSKVFRESLDNAKPEDFSVIGKSAKESQEAFNEIADSILSKSKTKKEAFDSLKNLVDTENIRPEIYDEIIERLAKDYDGYHFNGGDIDGGATNDIFVFDGKSKLDAGELTTRQYKDMSQRIANQGPSTPTREQGMFFNLEESKAMESLDDILPDKKYTEQRADMEKHFSELNEPELKQFRDPEIQKMIDDAQMEMKELDLDEKLFKSVFSCIKG